MWEGLFTSPCPHGDHWSDPVILLLPLLLLGCLCPVASRRSAPSVIPAHGPDSHHKAPIVFAGWIGSLSASHSAATCVTRRHSGACFAFCYLLSCLDTEIPSLKRTLSGFSSFICWKSWQCASDDHHISFGLSALSTVNQQIYLFRISAVIEMSGN